MAYDSHAVKPVGWNGIHFHLPQDWDVTVKGNCHLIIEQALQPFLEFRWQKKGHHPSKKSHAEFILSQLHKETKKRPQIIESPQFLQPLPPHFEVSAFSLDGLADPSGAVITCRNSGTLILFQFFNITPSSAKSLLCFFKTFNCCMEDEQNSSWSIDDLTFLLPQHFTLDRYSFSLGLTQFHFKSRGSDLKLCRLATASKHLERSTFKNLFAHFNGGDPENCTVIDNNTLVMNSSPSLGDRLLWAIKRKKIHHWGKFCYFTDQDKILGLYLASSQPLDRDQVTLLDRNYGFVQ